MRTNKPTDAPPAAKKLRRYDEAYLQFGFTVTADLRPQCVVCAEVLANDSMKPCKLKRHLETKHAGIKNKPAEYFKRKLDGLHQQQATISVHSTVSKQCLEASYVVAKRIGKLGNPHTIAETLILPAAQDMCRIMIGDSAAAKLGAVPLSNDTVARRIEDMSNDIREQLIEFVKKSPYYALQLDESTDIAGQAQLLTYVRYLRDKAIEEEVLFCRPLQSHTTGEAIFNVLDIFIRENVLAWDRCVGLCTDGAQAMTGRERGLAARVQQVAPLVKWTHCMVHREALAAKKMPVLFDSVLNQSVKMINLIKSPVFARPRNSYFAPCRQSARLHTKTRPLAWPHQSRELRHVPRAVVLKSGLGLESGLETFFYRLGLVLDSLVFGLGLVSDLVSTESSNICFFFLFQNKDSLVPQMGNVIAIGLTPSRTGIVIGPSRTGIVIGTLLNAQLRHMSVRLALRVRAAWRHKLSLFWPQTRCRQVA